MKKHPWISKTEQLTSRFNRKLLASMLSTVLIYSFLTTMRVPSVRADSDQRPTCPGEYQALTPLPHPSTPFTSPRAPLPQLTSKKTTTFPQPGSNPVHIAGGKKIDDPKPQLVLTG